MSNNTTATINKSNIQAVVVAYYALSLIIVGAVLNLLTFVVLCRPKFRNIKEHPTLYYMRTTVIFDFLMLCGWNLDHYTVTVHGFELATYSMVSCKLVWFLNYFAAQTSAWLRVLISLDRYLSLSRLHRTLFGRSKNVIIIISCVIGFFTLFNIHLIIFGCFHRRKNGLFYVNSRSYTIHPIWDLVHLVMYNCLPFLLMVILNSGVIYHLIRLRHTTTLQNSRIHHRTISITAVVTTFLFLIMTIPATVGFGFFGNTTDDIVLFILDSLLYTYHILSFPLYIITFNQFRQECIKMMTCNSNNRRVTAVIPLVTN